MMTETWKTWEGQVVNGEFRLLQYLGASDDSAVFLTNTEQEGQKTVLKFIAADPIKSGSQLSQWGAAAQLSHPNLLRIFHTGRCQLGGTDLLFVVMEYAEENLSQVLPQRLLTPAEARDFLRPVLDGLAYLHDKGFTHGHLKPSNIMAVGDQVKLSSDRICKIGELPASPEKPGAYDPPEKASRGASAAADVWSLGMTLTEALTGRLPQLRDQGEPVVPQGLVAPFSDIVRNCLRRDPEQRSTTADIAACLDQRPTAPQKAETARPRATAARPRWIMPTVVAGLVLAAVLGGWHLLRRQPGQNLPAAAEPTSPPLQSQQKPEALPPLEATQKGREQQPSPGGTPQLTSTAQSPAEATTSPSAEGDVVHRVVPDVPASARATITGKVKVRVRVRVDAAGNVAEAEFVSPGPSKYFARLAMQAAQRWKFSPASDAGQNPPREWVLRFEFGRTGTRVVPARATP
ncbi:MAG TPA: TonB family protein [Terriglobales bacterium]|nr:TonB family protein [Terriglobales bacterium]